MTRKARKSILGIILIISSVLFFSTCTVNKPNIVSKGRGRPQIKDGTVLTDKGTLMRGMVFSVGEMQMGDYNPDSKVTYQDIAKIKEMGMNCVRFNVPLQHYQKGSPEYQEALVRSDQFIDWAEELGLYVELSADWFCKKDSEEIDFENIKDYWRELAPRYSKRSHVFYDLVNELSEAPIGMDWTHPRGTIIAFYQELYTLVRQQAPDTLCIFFSFSHMLDIADSLLQIQQLEELIDIDWSNEAIGFHSYESTNKYDDVDIWLNSEMMRQEIRYLKAQGYPLINNEVPSLGVAYDGYLQLTSYPNPYLIKVLEEEGISWISMLDIMGFESPANWRGIIEAADISWQADYGDWPLLDKVQPFEKRAAISQPYELSKGYISIGENKDVEEVGNVYKNYIPCIMVNKETSVSYKDLNFGVREPLSLTVRLRGFYDGAKLRVHDGDKNGEIICEIEFNHTAGENVYYTAYLTKPLSGLKDITFTFVDPEGQDCWALCYLIEWQFNAPEQLTEAVHTDIWNKTTAAAAFSYRQGDLWREVADDSKAKSKLAKDLIVSNIKDDDRLLYDKVVFVNVSNAKFIVRAKTLAGGKIEIYATRGFRLWPNWSLYLGACAINGTAGKWEEFVLELDSELLKETTYNGAWKINSFDLLFRFVANEENNKKDELFEISEFTFQAIKVK